LIITGDCPALGVDRRPGFGWIIKRTQDADREVFGFLVGEMADHFKNRPGFGVWFPEGIGGSEVPDDRGECVGEPREAVYEGFGFQLRRIALHL